MSIAGSESESSDADYRLPHFTVKLDAWPCCASRRCR
jgi:hypothetical protein